MKKLAAVMAALLVFADAPASAQVLGGVVSVQVRPGVTVRYLALGKAKNATAVMLFAGGNGFLKLNKAGAITAGLAQNFLVRSRQAFAARGLFVAVVDTPGQVALDGNVRLSAQYAADMAKVIAHVRGFSKAAKVWLVGTSAGTLSAVGIASRSGILLLPRTALAASRPDGIVLTSTQTTLVAGLCGKTVFNANLAAIAKPVFVVSHRDDACPCSPAASAPAVLLALTNAPVKESAQFTGGLAKSNDPCMALTHHGFLGIDAQVVAAIADWIAVH